MAKKDSFDAKKAVEDVKKDKKLMLLVGGATALLIGMFLPWVSVNVGEASSLFGTSLNYSANGLDANGLLPIILLAAAVLAGLNVFNQDRKKMYITAAAVSALALLVVLVDWPDTDGLGTVSVGLGYYLSLLGSAAMTAGSGLLLKEHMDSSKKK